MVAHERPKGNRTVGARLRGCLGPPPLHAWGDCSSAARSRRGPKPPLVFGCGWCLSFSKVAQLGELPPAASAAWCPASGLALSPRNRDPATQRGVLDRRRVSLGPTPGRRPTEGSFSPSSASGKRRESLRHGWRGWPSRRRPASWCHGVRMDRLCQQTSWPRCASSTGSVGVGQPWGTGTWTDGLRPDLETLQGWGGGEAQTNRPFEALMLHGCWRGVGVGGAYGPFSRVCLPHPDVSLRWFCSVVIPCGGHVLPPPCDPCAGGCWTGSSAGRELERRPVFALVTSVCLWRWLLTGRVGESPPLLTSCFLALCSLLHVDFSKPCLQKTDLRASPPPPVASAPVRPP